MLAAAFDWLPHVPHEIESRTDRFRATSILIDPWLSPLYLWQNYDLIHHLYPALPFYRYTAVWRLDNERLLKQGARIRSVVPAWRRGQIGRRDPA
jgi:beta-carotene hydroxylase